MRVLIQNYNDILSTQNFYIHQCLSMVDSVEVKLWNVGKESVYDCLDGFKPDLVIANAKILDPVLLKYLSENKNINLIVNCSRCNQTIIDYLEDQIKELGVNCSLFFSEGYGFLVNNKSKEIKFSCIMPGIDVFLNPPPMLDYKIDNCIISTETSEEFEKICSNNEKYHRMIFGVDLHSEFDLECNINNLASLARNYREVTLVGDIQFVCSQIFFDCMLRCEKVSVKPREDQNEDFIKVLKALFSEDQQEVSIEKIKQEIESNHTCIHRTCQLMIDAGYEDKAKDIINRFGESNGK